MSTHSQMATTTLTPSLPLHETTPRKNTLIHRASDLAILLLLLALVTYRLTSVPSSTVDRLALLCELWFAFYWALNVHAKWTPMECRTYPDRLSPRAEHLPAVDMFVTTADPALEPPIITANTVLSMLAVDYPADKLACYVSDDGGSPATFHAMVEASKFADVWVPFCRRHNVRVRAPFMYFSTEPEFACESSVSPDFMHEWSMMKDEYGKLCGAIEKGPSSDDMISDFANFERGNHPSLVKVIRENGRNCVDGVPHLIYVAREKRPNHPHHYKAGAMNVLTRVSGLMTDSPFILNVDCDMFVNNPDVVKHAMCLLLGLDDETMIGFAQFPQIFYDGLKDDPLGNQLVALQHHVISALRGLQGPFYIGTGCFHRRKVIYGSSPNATDLHGAPSYKALKIKLGDSRGLVESAANILASTASTTKTSTASLSDKLEDAKRVTRCTFELNTSWGAEIGWIYGSTAEDFLTGLHIHSRGWRSAYCTPDPPAFLGSAPTSGLATLTQYRRWFTGLMEVLLDCRNGPVASLLTKRLQLRQCCVYLLFALWAVLSLPELCYSLLPAYCLLTNTPFLPKTNDAAVVIPAAIFVVYNLSSLLEYIECGLTVRAWWNNQRMRIMLSPTAMLFGLVDVALKLVGVSETVFAITRKDQNASRGDDDDDGKGGASAESGTFTFDGSPIFVPVVALVLVNMVSLVVGPLKMWWGWHREVSSSGTAGVAELVCSGWVVVSSLPIARGLFGRGACGIPWSTIFKAGVVGSIFIHLCVAGSPDI